jgi:hypothetical protein
MLTQQLAKPIPLGQQLEIEARTRGCSASTFYECLELLLQEHTSAVVYDPDQSVTWYANGSRVRTNSLTGERTWSFKHPQWSAEHDFYPQAWKFSTALEDQVVPPSVQADPGAETNSRRRSHWHVDLSPGSGPAQVSVDLYRWLDGDPQYQFAIEVDVTLDPSAQVRTPATHWWPVFKSTLGRYVHPNQFLLCTRAPVELIDQWLLHELARQVHPTFPHFARTRPKTESTFQTQLTKDFRVSLKLDGQNEVFLVSFENGVLALVVNHVQPVEVRYINAPLLVDSAGGGGGGRRVQHVLQGEWMRELGTLYLFDALVVEGKSLMTLNHTERLRPLHDPEVWARLCDRVQLGSAGSLRVARKVWAPTVELLRSSSPSLPNDGYIWMDSSRKYTEMVVFKDKPQVDLTIDVSVTHLSAGVGERLCWSGVDGLVDRWAPWPQVAIEWARNSDPPLPDMYWVDLADRHVVECKLVLGSKHPGTMIYPFRLEPVRVRPGKARGNAPFVVKQTLESLAGRPAMVTARNNTTIEACRQTHNLVKQHLLSQYLCGPNILDIGFGKGGDLLKYQHCVPTHGVKRVWAIEPNLDHWTQALNRFTTQARPFDFELTGVQPGTTCQTVDLDRLGSLEVDTVVMMFSLAYLWDSAQSLNHWLKLLDQCRARSLILTFMDQYALADLCVQHRSSKLVFNRGSGGGGMQTVEFHWPQVRASLDKGGDVFGYPVLVSIVPSQTARHVVEWLVHQPTLMRELMARGWQLVHNKLFSGMEGVVDQQAPDPWHGLFRAQVWSRR